MTKQPKAPKHEFRVTIGIELHPETVKKITQAVQKSVLAELASADLKAPLAVDFSGPAPGDPGFPENPDTGVGPGQPADNGGDPGIQGLTVNRIPLKIS